jgi:DNA-binding CsgD family transcriptional regulator
MSHDVDHRLHRFSELARIRAVLNACQEVDELFSQAAEAARVCCGFERALILGCEPAQLTATSSGPLAHAASESLRRKILGAPVALHPGTPETALAQLGATATDATTSALATDLGLTNHVFAAVSVEGRSLALLVVDRPAVAPDALDAALVAACADIVSVVVERIVLRARTAELSVEIRYLAESARGLMTEVIRAPISLPTSTNRGHMVFPRFESSLPDAHSRAAAHLLTERETEIAARLAAGCSNRDIADELFLAPSTVKGTVARIMRKLDASNRAEAAVRYLQLHQQSTN